jgi:hypothetical protein
VPFVTLPVVTPPRATVGAAMAAVLLLGATPGATATAGRSTATRDASPRTGVAAPVVNHPCASPPPEAVAATPDAAPQDALDDYAATTPHGWTGGDSTYSVQLPDGRRVWLFSDTFLGPLDPDGARPTTAPMVNNSFVVQRGNRFTTVTGGAAGHPTAIMPPPGSDSWYWLGDGMVADVDGTHDLQVVFDEWERYGDGGWDYRLARTVVATFSLHDLSKPLRVDPLPSATHTQWGSALLPASRSGDGYTYIYGISDSPTNKQLRIARVPGSDLSRTDRWQFLDTGRQAWMRGEAEGTDVLPGVSSEFSVTPWHGDFALVSQDGAQAFSPQIRLWSGCDPYGPFGSQPGSDLVYTTPETGASGGYHDPDVYTYNAKVHPSLAAGGRWTLSYNVNSFDTSTSPDGDQYRDPSIYRPRFVSFRLVPSIASGSSGSSGSSIASGSSGSSLPASPSASSGAAAPQGGAGGRSR